MTSPLAETCTFREGRPPRRPHCNRTPWRLRSRRPALSSGGTTSASSALQRAPPHRPHRNRTPWRLRLRRPALSRGGTTSASSALQPLTAASSAFPRSERVYPAIMPLAAISPGDPSWRKASRYALQPLTSASSAFPRSERVYPAIMPLAAIRPGVKPVATSAWGGTTSASSALPHRTALPRGSFMPIT